MIIPEGFAQITWLFDGPITPNGAAITLGVDLGSVTDLADVADAAQLAFNSGPGSHLDAGASGTTIRVKAGPNDTGLGADFARSFGGAGSGAAASPNVALLVRKRTSTGGRAGRGRFYFPGVSEDQVSESGVLASTSLAAYTTDMAQFMTAFTGNGLLPVVFHGPDSPATLPSIIQAFEPDGRVATQRRRLRR